MTRTRHAWIEEDDIALLLAIDEAGPLRDHYERQGYKAEPWWASRSRVRLAGHGSLAWRRKAGCRRTAYPTSSPRTSGTKVASMVAQHESAAREHIVATLQALLEAALDRVQAGA
jgi:hypothetical protein